MKVSDIVQELGLTVITGENNLNNTITGGYTSDLLSDVMGNLSEGEIWITLQTHRNVMAVASLKEASAILLVKSLQPDEDLLTFAQEEEMPILSTAKGAFEVSALIYNRLSQEVKSTD